MEPLKLAIIVYVSLILIISSIVDIKTKKIPNWITLPAIVVGMGISFWMNWQGALMILGIFLFIIVTSSFGIYGGMGDVKLFMALIALTHWDFIPSLFISIILFILTYVLIFPNTAFNSLGNVFSKIRFSMSLSVLMYYLASKCKVKKKEVRDMPYAPFISMGYLILFIAKVIECIV